jgi:hypothetical protein
MVPVHAHAAQTASWIFTGCGAAFLIGCLGWAARRSLRDRDPLALLALLGGAIASLEESWIDSLIKLWYPRDAPLVAFTSFGTPQPLYLHLIYPGFVGLGSYAVYLGLRRSGRARVLWIGLVGIAALDLIFELPATAGHVFSYYGSQPFQLLHNGWPAWVAPINGAGPTLGGWLLFVLAPRLRGAQRLLLALAPPLAYAAVYGMTGWPTFTLLNSSAPGVVRWLAASVTIALCFGVIKLLAISLPEPATRTRTVAAEELELTFEMSGS